jgi:hypothetical protein
MEARMKRMTKALRTGLMQLSTSRIEQSKTTKTTPP